MIEIRKYIKFFFDYFVKRYGEEVVLIPTIFEQNGIEIDLIVGEQSSMVLGIRFLQTYSDDDENEEDGEFDDEVINLRDLGDESIEPDEMDELEEDLEEEDDEDIIWDFTKISAQSINGIPILSFVFDYDKYGIDNENLEEDKQNDETDEGEEEIILIDKVIKIEIYARNGKPMGACIKKFDKKRQKELEILGYFSLDSELFRRQIIF